jgi:hypothetical protein
MNERKIMKTTLKRLQLVIPLVLILTFASYGCKDSVVAPAVNNIEFSSIGSEDTVDATGLLVITEAKLMVKDIKLNTSGNSDSSNFKVGPYVLYLTPYGSIQYMDETIIPPGTYDKVAFKVHKLELNETPSDPDFVDVNGRYSVVVRGTFAGVAFTYKSDKSAHQKLSSQNSLVIGGTTKTNITLRVKPYMWFIKNGAYLDPADPNNSNDIDNNIKDNINNNFKCFKDDNKDGQPD